MSTQAHVDRLVVQVLVDYRPRAHVDRVVVQLLIGPTPAGGWGVGFVRMGPN